MTANKAAPSKFLFLLKEDELKGMFPEWPDLMNLAVWVDVNAEFSLTVCREEELDKVIARIAEEADMDANTICVIPKQEGYPTADLLFSDEQAIIKTVAESNSLVEMASDYSVNYQFCLDEGIDPQKALEPKSDTDREHMKGQDQSNRYAKDMYPEPAKNDTPEYLTSGDLIGVRIVKKDLSMDANGAIRVGSLSAEDHVVEVATVLVARDFGSLRFDLEEEADLRNMDVVLEGHGIDQALVRTFCGPARLFVRGREVTVERLLEADEKSAVVEEVATEVPVKRSNRALKVVGKGLAAAALIGLSAAASFVVSNAVVDTRTAGMSASSVEEPGELNFQELRDRILEGKPFSAEEG